MYGVRVFICLTGCKGGAMRRGGVSGEGRYPDAAYRKTLWRQEIRGSFRGRIGGDMGEGGRGGAPE